MPNPSFESYTACPYTTGQLNYSTSWFNPSTGTADLFNICSPISGGANVPNSYMGYSNAFSGNGFTGLFINYDPMGSTPYYREYLGVRLNSTLILNAKYYLTLYVKLADSSRYASRSIGLFFYPDSISKSNYDTLKVNNQISNTQGFVTSKNMWTKIRGSIVSNGLEKYLYIGNFNPTNSNDTIAVSGGGRPFSDYRSAYYFIDNVCLSNDSSYAENYVTNIVETNFLSSKNCNIFPNPTNGIFEVEGHSELKSLLIYDVFGNKMEFSKCNNKIDITLLFPGTYIVEIEVKNQVKYKFKLIKL